MFESYFTSLLSVNTTMQHLMKYNY